MARQAMPITLARIQRPRPGRIMRAAFWPHVRQSEFMPNLPYWRLSGFYFFYFAFVGAMSPFWGLYLQSLAYNAFEIGVLMSLLQVMRIFAPNIWGHIADRSGRRTPIVQIAAMGSVLVFTGVFVGSGFWWLFAVMAALSFFWSASLPLVEAMTLSHLGERTDAYGRIRLWGSIGFILMVVGLGYAFDHVAIGWLWALGVLCEIGIFLIIPRIFARVTPRRLILASFALAVLRFLMIAWGVESPWLVWGAQTLHAFTFGTYHAAAVALIHQHFRGRHQARGQALYTSLSYGVGGTIGGLASGLTWESPGPAWTFTLAAVSSALAWAVYAAWGKTKTVPASAQL